MISLTPAQYKSLKPLGKGHLKDFKAKIPKALSTGEETLALQLKAAGIGFLREFKFNPVRKWRADFALSAYHPAILIEVEGGIYHGRHTRPQGFTEDCEKYNEAAVMGWRVLRFTTEHVKSGYAIDCIRKAIA